MTQVYPHFHIVLLAVDYGEKLWPIAREQSPACFAPAGAESKESLLTATVARTLPYTEYPLEIVTTAELSQLLCGELKAHAGLSDEQFELLVAPAQRGSAFSIALVCARIRRSDPDAVIAVLPVDQRVNVDDRWARLLFRAYQVALNDHIVLVGVRQHEKCRDYSYIRPGRHLDDADDVCEVRVFASDALPSTASRAINEGAYWYTGVFVGRAVGILGLLTNDAARRRPVETDDLQRIAEAASFFALVDIEAWRSPDAKKVADILPHVDIEKDPFENSKQLVVMPTSIEFSSIGALQDLDGTASADTDGNRTVGNALTVDSKNITILAQSPGRVIAAYGLEDIAVVDTVDALLVAKKSQLKDANRLLSALKDADVSQLTSSTRRPFPWGCATLIAKTATSVTWQVELPAGSEFEAFSIPLEFGTFSKKDEGRIREQYIVAEGDVVIKGQGEDAEAILMGHGDAFEADADDPLVIMCVQEAPATLILTAVV